MQRSEAASGGASSATPTWVAASVAGLVFFLAVGGLGLYRYLGDFWVYRGFVPTHDPAYVVSPGTETSFDVASPALGGRRQQVVVYLPPGYDPEVVEIFTSEAAELLDALESSIAMWQANPGDGEGLREAQRALHTFKGGARMAGLLAMGLWLSWT